MSQINSTCRIVLQMKRKSITEETPHATQANEVKLQKPTFYQRINGYNDELRPFISYHTHRTLKPYIRQDFQTEPPKLRLLREIQQKSSSAKLPKFPINYTYIQPRDVSQINRMACKFFWPGIDGRQICRINLKIFIMFSLTFLVVSECLKYPDFTCVVSYKKLIVGFACMVPDYSQTEAYISYIFTHPEWRRHGIAKFMLYHLAQVFYCRIGTFQRKLTALIFSSPELSRARHSFARLSNKPRHLFVLEIRLQN